ncbi:hypothetical protein KEJ26_04950 [Candidatus Bathyarchaeota archaeon]|nr:hypothetical protein [Candidatus Bathyarchaeota archaeon]
MKIDWLKIFGLAASIAAACIFVWVLLGGFKLITSFPPPNMVFFDFLWTFRLIDIIAQAFVLFAAAACCAAMLRREKGEEG